MVVSYADEFNQYLEGAESVLGAGKQLQSLFNKSLDMRNFAVDQLEREFCLKA